MELDTRQSGATNPDQTFQIYERVRAQVLGTLDWVRQRRETASPSAYWREELEGFDYMLEASPSLVRKLRHQTYHLTGLKVYDYRSTQEKRRLSIEAKYRELRKLDPQGKLFVPESPLLGGFGHSIDGHLMNLDTLKFYESFLALERGGVIGALQMSSRRPVIAEVGAGWGGFLYQFKRLLPNATYVVVDFPEVMLFSAVYLMTHFPGSRVLFVDKPEAVDELNANAASYDFVFFPQEMFAREWALPVDLAANMVSFQEMTSAQVEGYASRFRDAGLRWIYSHNRERSGHNRELSTVSEILSRYYSLSRIKLMSGGYTDLGATVIEPKVSAPAPRSENRGLFERARRRLAQTLLSPSERSALEKAFRKPKLTSEAPETVGLYRHYIGTPLPSIGSH